MEAIRALTVAQRSGRTTSTTALTQLCHLGFCAPEPLRQWSSATAPARSTATCLAADTLRAAGLTPEPADVLTGCPQFDLSTRRSSTTDIGSTSNALA